MKTPRFPALLLCLAMLLSLAACGQQNETPSSPTAEPVVNDETAAASEMALDTGNETVKTADAETIAAILAETDGRRSAIMGSPTEVTYAGNAFYVSSSTGDDANDGTSPDHAVRTVWRLETLPIRSGDAVLFKRGDLWRGEMLWCREGVTYSAYGEGSKPRFYGCKENGVGSEKWALYHEQDGIKIWKFYRDMLDVGGIVFNSGEQKADRTYGWWIVGSGYMRLDDLTKPFLPEENLQEDMTCCSVIDYTGLDYPIMSWNARNADKRGALYLRCDAGNPGALFDELEFEVTDVDADHWTGIFIAADGCTFDNLCIMYFSDTAIMTMDTPYRRDITVQNCEFAWCGNSMFGYESAEPSREAMASGDCLYGIAGTVAKNYFHHLDCAAITFESNSGYDTTSLDLDLVIKDNLIERCGAGITIMDPWGVYTSVQGILVQNNIFLYTGEDWIHSGYHAVARWAVGIIHDLPSRCDIFDVSDNLVYCVADSYNFINIEPAAIPESNRFFR